MKKIITFILIGFYQFSFAQSTLTVQCQQNSNFPDSYYNQILLDGNIIEYGLCNLTPSFYVAIFDTACTPWQTTYAPFGSEGFNYGNQNYEGGCQPRPMFYFNYYQNEVQDLSYLDSLINLWIPVDHAFVIYTPISYDASQVASLSPTLAQTFENLWGVEAVQTHSMVVLFGVQGYPASFAMDTLTTGTFIEFNTQICPHAEQTAEIKNLEGKDYTFKVFPNPVQDDVSIEIKGNDLTSIEIIDMQGNLIQRIDIEANIEKYKVNKLNTGLYVVLLMRDGEVLEQTKIVISE